MFKQIVDIKDIMNLATTKSKMLKESILKSEWSKIVGELADKSFVLFLKQETLFIGVENSVWLHHMTLKKSVIIENSNNLLNGLFIKELKFKVIKKIELEPFLDEKSREDSYDLKGIILTEKEYIEIKNRLAEIDNKDIKNRTKIILEKAYKKNKYLLLHGYKKCKCGIYYNSIESMCHVCLNRHNLKIEEALMRALKERKIFFYSQAVKIFKSITEQEFNRIKKKELSKIKKEIDLYFKNEKYRLALELSKLYFSIESGKHDDKEIEKKAEAFVEMMKNR